MEGAPVPLRARLWAAAGHIIKPKELKESCAFYDCVRRDVRKLRPARVLDVCGGHGALAMLFLAHGQASEALVVDLREPPSFARLRDAWAPFLPGPVLYDARPLQQALPEALASDKPTLVVACHACQHLARQIMEHCVERKVAFAVCPCCFKDRGGHVEAAAKALAVDFSTAMVLAEMGRLSAVGCGCALRSFDATVSPQNKVLLGRPGLALAEAPEAEEKLRRAYERAHHSSSSDARAAGSWCSEQELPKKREALQALLEPLTGAAAWDRLEVRESPTRHFRARTVIAVGDAPEEGGGLFRLVPESDGFRVEHSTPLETLLPQLSSCVLALAELLPADSAALRCVKLQATLGTKQLLCCLVYGPPAELPSLERLEELRGGLLERLKGLVEVLVVMASAKGQRRGVPEGRDWVEEVLHMPRRGEVRYRQPFGQFSNPNPHIAIATAEWLGDVLRAVTSSGTDLLELYCGCGSHTVALAPFFRHVLAVEINRHLVAAAEHNVKLNGLSNVKVLRAPSEDFCGKLLRRRSYELQGETLNFGCTLVDPPRAGLDAVTLQAVAGYPEVLYVSCNPMALKSNLEVLLKSHELRRMVLLDHFPCSKHVEMAVHLSKFT